MSTNAIPTRILGFIKDHPPFSYLSTEDLMRISEEAVVRYCQAGEKVFAKGEPPRPFIYIVKEGAIHLEQPEEASGELVEVCGEGDVFGIRPLLAAEPYALDAVASEETLLYKISVDGFRSMLEQQPRVAWYLAQIFAAGKRNHTAEQATSRWFAPKSKDDASNLTEVQPVNYTRDVLTCGPDSSIQAAAKKMREARVGSIIITDNEQHPLGIVTDQDLRNLVATGDVSLGAEVREIMSSPVQTAALGVSVAEVQISMMQRGIHHLVLTEDGSPQSPIQGIVSDHDVLVIHGNNPAALIREIRRSQQPQQLQRIRARAEGLLQRYLEQEVSISFICTVMSQVNDALIVRCIELAQQQLSEEGTPPPDVEWCWLGLGSEGREEQLLRTDQDNALVYADVPEAQQEKVASYFLRLAQLVNQHLNVCGFEFCPADMMAGNPKWCLSLSDWKAQFSDWILKPTEQNIMLCSIFFDYRPIYGDNTLADGLSQHIFEQLGKTDLFLSRLAKDALRNPPPLTFFRNFVVEKSGEHKDQFDIKARAMMPLADAARVLILHARQPSINNTFHRFDHLAELEPQNKELLQQAADAYEILLRYRAVQGLRQKSSGRYILPDNLTKMERLNLRNCFKPIGDLHQLLEVRFRLGFV